MIREGKQSLATIAAVKASGSITCVAKANFVDGETITIDDGTNEPTVIEIDVAGDGVGAGNTQADISGATTAADVAAILRTAINSVTTGLTVTANAPTGGVLPLLADTEDATHNVAITHTVANSGFSVTGMAGGITAGGAVAGTAVPVSGLKDVEVWLTASAFVGTYVVQISHDGGVNYATVSTAQVTEGATNTSVKLPACDYFKVSLTVGTSGTLNVAWAGTELGSVIPRP